MSENCKVKQIDRKILEELRKNLEIQIGNVNVINKAEVEEILRIIEEKKRGIFLLFQGDFTLNEHNIKEKKPVENRKPSFYDRVANNVISKRIKKTFNKMMDLDARDHRLISVCTDRQIFIQSVISENMQTSFIESCINGRER